MNIFCIIGVVVAIIVVAGFFWDCTFEQTLRRSVSGLMYPPRYWGGRRGGAAALTAAFNLSPNADGLSLGPKRHGVLIELTTDIQPAPWSIGDDVSSKGLQILRLQAGR